MGVKLQTPLRSQSLVAHPNERDIGRKRKTTSKLTQMKIGRHGAAHLPLPGHGVTGDVSTSLSSLSSFF